MRKKLRKEGHEEIKEIVDKSDWCSNHMSPLIQWCWSCSEAMCATCIAQHQPTHKLVDLHLLIHNKKQIIIENCVTALTQVKDEKQQLTKKTGKILNTLAEMYEQSQAAGQRERIAEKTITLAASTHDLNTLIKVEESLYTLNSNQLKVTQNKSNIEAPLWSLTNEVTGANGRQWHRLPWLHFIQQIPAMQLVMPPQSPEVYLQLSLDGRDLGRIHIRLWGHLHRAQHFLALCLGTFGVSYQGMEFRGVERRGEPGESLRGGDYLIDDGSTSCYGLMTDLEWGGEHAGSAKRGMVAGAGGGHLHSDALFNICLRDKPHGIMACPFGVVVFGLDIMNQVTHYHGSPHLTIVQSGLVFHNS